MIGLATIGQAPRDDVLPAMFSPLVAPSVRQAGALDTLSREEIGALAPQENEHPLVTRLSSGEEVVIAKERVLPHLLAAIRRLEADGVRLICILCTGEFDFPEEHARLIYPERLVRSVVDNILPSGRLGVVIPHAGQNASMQQKWRAEARELVIEVVSPYQGESDYESAFERLADAGADVVVLDCMGYGLDLQRVAAHLVGGPVILSNRLVGAVIESIAVQPVVR